MSRTPRFPYRLNLFGRSAMYHFVAWVAVIGLMSATPPCFAQEDEDFQRELPRIAPLEPAEALTSFEVADGFRLELAAHEPLVHDPVAMSFDEQGRLFVVEMRGYSEQGEESLGVVRMLTDEDGDGRFDRATDYVDQLSWPTAVICYDGGVFIGVAPDVLYCKDTDGDGKADLRQRVFTGFLRHNVQGLLNSFQWGVDNRIHGAPSSCGGNVVRGGASDNVQVSLRGRDFSFDPRRFDLRPESGGAQHGMSFDAWGRKFMSSNSDHLQAVLIADRYFARNPYYAAPGGRESIALDGPQAEVFRISPVEPWRIVRTRLRVAGKVPGPIEGGGRAAGYFTGATGATIYDGDAWPDVGIDDLWAFVGDVGSNIVHRKRVTPKGASFIGERVDGDHEFVASKDIWFRPAQFCNGPDGCLYILDVYREVIEHPASLPPQIKRHLDLTSGRDRGRIYRVVPREAELRHTVDLANASDKELVELLGHRNGWHRRTAARLLVQRQPLAIVSHLEQLTQNNSQPLAQMHALYVLQSFGRLSWKSVRSGLEAAHPRVREHALVLAEQFVGKVDTGEWLSAVGQLVDDSDAAVRKQLALTAGAVDDPRTDAWLLALLNKDHDDPWIVSAVLCSVAPGVDRLRDELLSNDSFRDSSSGAAVLERLSQISAAKQKDQGRALVEGARQLGPQEVEPLRRAPVNEAVIAEYIRQHAQSTVAASTVSRGAELFKKHCAVCHDIGTGVGGLGPNLATMRARGAEAIITNVLDPNREVNPQFVSYVAELDDGRSVSGILTEETATSVTLAMEREKRETVLKIQIEQLQSTGKSLMPEDFQKQISAGDMSALVSFLLDEEP
jgi:putative membrane-bound dehydrogenase-like protein